MEPASAARPQPDRAALNYTLGTLAEALAWIVCVVSTATIISQHDWKPWHDQLALVRCSPLRGPYPAWTAGLSTCWLSAVASAFAGDDVVRANSWLRLLAASAYLAAAAALAHATLETRGMRILVAFVLVGSLYPFVWVSSELTAGAGLMAAVLAVMHGSPALAGIALAVFAFTKPDTPLTALVLLAARYAHERERAARQTLVLTAVLGACALLAPGVWQKGFAYLADAKRADASFGQHAHILFSRSLEWRDGHEALGKYFPGAETVGQALWLHPQRYAQFVALSLLVGLRSARLMLGPLVWVLLPALLGAWLARIDPPRIARYFVLTLVGLVPMVLLSFPHMRYLARFFPLLVLALAATVDRLSESVVRFAPYVRATVAMLFIGASAIYAIGGTLAILDSLALPQGAVFWSAD